MMVVQLIVVDDGQSDVPPFQNPEIPIDLWIVDNFGCQAEGKQTKKDDAAEQATCDPGSYGFFRNFGVPSPNNVINHP